MGSSGILEGIVMVDEEKKLVDLECCPMCGSDEVSFDLLRSTSFENLNIALGFVCDACGAEWENHYVFKKMVITAVHD